MFNKSKEAYEKACQVIPGGVNSPVRAFNGVGGTPVYFEKGSGAYLTDIDGQTYIDFVGSWGPMLLGQNHPAVIERVKAAVSSGLSFGAPTLSETVLAQMIVNRMPSIEKVRLVSSGTEATMTAIRLARGYTSRDIIIKFTGCYHGHSDSLLIKAGSGALTGGVPTSPGVPAALAEKTITLPFNDIEALSQAFESYGREIACVIVEPVAGNMGCIPPKTGFLESILSLCDAAGSLMICDEVMTGFRVSLAGAQGYYGISPHLTTLGKIVGGGMPVGAIGGASKYMDYLAPLGPVYQAGTLSGNPITVAAGIATLEQLSAESYLSLKQITDAIVSGIKARAEVAKVPLIVNSVPGMFSLFFTDQPAVETFDQVSACDIERYKKFFHLLLSDGVYLAPSAYETAFTSLAMGPLEIQRTLNAVEKALAKL